MRKIVHRLSSKVAFYLAGISLIVTFLMTALQIAYEYQSKINLLKKHVNDFHRLHSMNLYENTLTNKNDLLLANENILSVQLLNKENQTFTPIYESKQYDAQMRAHQSRMIIPLSNHVNKEIHYTINLQMVYEKIKSIFWSTLFLHALRSFLIAIFLYILIDRAIIYRLQFIENRIQQFDVERKTKITQNQVPQFGRNKDEIDRLYQTISNLFSRLQDQHQKLEKELSEKKEVQNQLFQTSMQMATQQTTSGMFHDLNNLLMICLGGAELLKIKADEKLQPTVQKIDKSLNLAIELIRAQQQSSKKVDKPELYSIQKIIHDAILLEERSMKRDGIDLSIQIEKDFETLMPKSLVILVLLNLLKNSREAIKESNTEDGKIIVHATVDHSYWKISVIDNGPGVKKEFQSKLFSFGETTKTDGHGFGISHCRQALELNQGGLKYESKNAFLNGACFTLWLPFQPATEHKIAS